MRFNSIILKDLIYANKAKSVIYFNKILNFFKSGFQLGDRFNQGIELHQCEEFHQYDEFHQHFEFPKYPEFHQYD